MGLYFDIFCHFYIKQETKYSFKNKNEVLNVFNYGL